MMFSPILKAILFTLVLYTTTEAAVSVFAPEDKPLEFADQKGCYLASLKLVLEIGVPYSPPGGDRCEQYICKENGLTQLLSCAAKGVGPGCEEIEGDKSLPYPGCCNVVRCYREDGSYFDN